MRTARGRTPHRPHLVVHESRVRDETLGRACEAGHHGDCAIRKCRGIKARWENIWREIVDSTVAEEVACRIVEAHASEYQQAWKGLLRRVACKINCPSPSVAKDEVGVKN